MFNPIPKNKPIRLKGAAYRRFKEQIHERDGWTCVNPDCECKKNPYLPTVNYILTVSHIQKRSQSGSDVPENVVTECMACHEKVETNMISHEFAVNYLARIYSV